MKNYKKLFLIFFILLITLFFSSCKKRNPPYYRINLNENWKYSTIGEPYPFADLPDNDLTQLSSLLKNQTGYIFIKNTFKISKEYRHKEMALYIGRVKLASKIYINNHYIGKTGDFPPHEFTEGNRSFAIKIPKEYINFGGENTIMICLWCHGYGSIDTQPFLSEYTDVEETADYYSLIYSKLYFVLSIILLIINLIYLFLYLLRRSELENMSFSQVCLFTALYLSVFYFGEYSFLKNIGLTYLMFEKIFKGATAILAGYMIICFTRDFLHYEEAKRDKIGRFIITVIGIIIPFTASNIPDFRSRLRIGFLFVTVQFIFLFKIYYVSIKRKDKKFFQYIICLTPFLLAFLSQVIAKIVIKQRFDTLLLAITWVFVIFLFLAILIIRFVNLANEIEFVNKNLEQLVADRTEALEKEKNRALKEIELAGSVQKSFYSVDTSEIKNWDVKIAFKPMAGVSGDLYILFISEGQLDGIGIFDISGHGIASGLVTMLVKNIIEQEFYKGKKLPLNEVMTKINDRIILEKGNIENYLTGLLIRFNKNDMELVNAGHPKALLYDSEKNSISFVENEGVNQYGSIGIADFPINFETVKFKMKKDDELVLYTDGITECTNSEKKYFGSQGVIDVFRTNVSFDIERQVNALTERLAEYSGSNNFDDDITYIILKKK